MSLYFFTKDVKDSKASACVDACLEAWPVFTTTSDTPTAEGVTGTVGTIASPDGKKHITLNGMPLYHYAKDKAPGDMAGQGVGGVWYLVSPPGEMIRGAAGSGYGSVRLQATHWGENMTQDISSKKTSTLTFLGVQELAWTLGLTAMIINATERGLDWFWVGLLACWQATIVWGFIKFRQARAS